MLAIDALNAEMQEQQGLDAEEIAVSCLLFFSWGFVLSLINVVKEETTTEWKLFMKFSCIYSRAVPDLLGPLDPRTTIFNFLGSGAKLHISLSETNIVITV